MRTVELADTSVASVGKTPLARIPLDALHASLIAKERPAVTMVAAEIAESAKETKSASKTYAACLARRDVATPCVALMIAV